MIPQDRQAVEAISPKGNASIQTKLALTFVVFLALIVGLGVFAVRQIEAVSSATRVIQDVVLPKIIAANDVERALTTHQLLVKRRAETTDFRQLAAIVRDMRAAEEQFVTQLKQLRQGFDTKDGDTLFESAVAHWERYLESVEDVRRLTEQGSLSRAQSTLKVETETAAAQLFDQLNGLIQSTRDETERVSKAVEAEYRRARKLSMAAVALGSVATLIAVFWIARWISSPLLRISSAMSRLTEGHHEARIPNLTHRADEIGVLARAATAFRSSMLETHKLVKEVGSERARLEATVRNMPLALCMFDKSGALMVSNDAFHEIFGLDPGFPEPGCMQTEILRAIGRNCTCEDPEAFVEKTLEAAAHGFAESALWHLRDDRSVSTILQPTPDGWMLIGEDVTDRVAAEDRIRRLARSDALTGLANRLAFQEEIEALLLTASIERPAAVMFIDLDRFKHINDTLGHPAGDDLLRQVSGRLKWTVGEQDTVARLGGDEFAVIQRGGEQPDAAMDLGQRIIEQLSSPFTIEGHRVQIGGSVGIAFAPVHGATPEEIQRNADLALYAVKEQGKGHCQVFNEAMIAKQKALHELEQALWQALDFDQFIMHYQPLFNVHTGRTYAAEALIRWQHPERGLVSPAEFIPLAEELGLIQPLGTAILEKTCEAAVTWPTDINLSVNLSPAQFHKHDVFSDVMRVLESSGLDPRRLELEITEGVLLEQTEKTYEVLHAFRAQGISIALDDFGTGYSSLRYLRAFPFDRVKIDASFIRGLPDDEGAVAIVEAISSMCRTFDIALTAEGIETQEQLDFVRLSGCTAGQGFLFSRPLPETEFATFIAQEQASDRRATGS